MLKQIKLLSDIQLCNVLGRNEAKHSKDKKKKSRLKLVTASVIFAGIVLLFYITLMSAVYAFAGMPEIIPSYTFSVTSLIIFFFSLFKAGGIIFNIKAYEREIVLPVSTETIIISRFFTMYLSDFLLSLMVIIPSSVIYAVFVKPPVMFYVSTVITSFFLPMLPLTAASVFGAVILYVSSKMRHKNIASIIFSLVFSLVIIIFSYSSSFKAESISNTEISQMSALLIEKMGEIYPPVKLFERSAVDGKLFSLILLVLISAVLFSAFVFIVSRRYSKICTAIISTSAKRNYTLGTLHKTSALKALYKKDLKRYLASSVYVMNTSIGYILMVVFSVAVAVMGQEKIDSLLGMNGIVLRFSPFLLAAMCVISPPTTSAISIEGKQLWIAKSLPLKAKTILDSKLSVTFTLAFPLCLISQAVILIALKPDVKSILLYIILPIVFIIFSSVSGLFINMKMPVFNWENETIIVKQSAAVITSMLTGFISIAIPVAASVALKGNSGFAAIIIYCVALLAVSIGLYVKMCKTDLNTL